MDVRIRRGQREDIQAIEHMLGGKDAPLEPRLMRRLVEDVTNDLFVVMDPVGDLIAVLAMGYRRSLAQRGQVACVDTLVVVGQVDGLPAAMLTFAETRARARGCRAIVLAAGVVGVIPSGMLVARGYGSEEGMVRC